MRFFTTVCFRCGVRWGGAATFMSLCTGNESYCAHAMDHTLQVSPARDVVYNVYIYIYKYVTSWAWSGGVG